MSIFRPFLLKKDITAVSVALLHEMEVKALLLDVDNTLTTHNSQDLNPAVSAWLEDVKQNGFTPVIVSNGTKKRVRPFAQHLGLPFTASAAKPLPIGFLRAMKERGLTRQECVVIGDQIFTDVLGGKAAGMRVIQVLPIDTATDTAFIRFKRKLEKIVMKRWEMSV